MSRKVYNGEKYNTDDKGNLRVASTTEIDPLGKWIVRSESKIRGFDIVFTGSGDEVGGSLEIGGGTPFTFDFSEPSQLITAPAGFKKTRTDWHFNDQVFIKEGTLYFYNMPKGSYVDMFIVCPAGYPYGYKVHGRSVEDYDKLEYAVATEETAVNRWIMNYHMEGTCPMGDEFNTESAADASAPTHYVWRAEVTVPEVTNWEECHGHWALELYRPSSVYFPAP